MSLLQVTLSPAQGRWLSHWPSAGNPLPSPPRTSGRWEKPPCLKCFSPKEGGSESPGTLGLSCKCAQVSGRGQSGASLPATGHRLCCLSGLHTPGPPPSAPGHTPQLSPSSLQTVGCATYTHSPSTPGRSLPRRLTALHIQGAGDPGRAVGLGALTPRELKTRVSLSLPKNVTDRQTACC